MLIRPDATAPGTLDALVEAEDRGRVVGFVRDELMRLAILDRRALVARLVDGQSSLEIGRRLGCAAETIDAIVARASEAIRLNYRAFVAEAA